MRTVKVGVLFAAGVNCDRETVVAFEQAGAVPERVHINELIDAPGRLARFQVLVIPGGFTYGDYIAAGRVLASELSTRLRPELERFIGAGKLVLGICNGFQVLAKAGILPGTDGLFAPPSVTLEFNESDKFEDRWVYLRPAERSVCVFTRDLPGQIYLPVAHAEGRFLARDQATLERLRRGGQVCLRYVSPEGGRAGYPANPNGSQDDIAGICDPTGRVFGLMPHPERNVEPHHHPRWTRGEASPDGRAIFANAVRYVRDNL